MRSDSGFFPNKQCLSTTALARGTSGKAVLALPWEGLAPTLPPPLPAPSPPADTGPQRGRQSPCKLRPARQPGHRLPAPGVAMRNRPSLEGCPAEPGWQWRRCLCPDRPRRQLLSPRSPLAIHDRRFIFIFSATKQSTSASHMFKISYQATQGQSTVPRSKC